MKIAQSISVLFLAFMLIFSTTGLAIYTHYCNAKNTATANLFQEAKCCGTSHSQHKAISCCSESETHDSTENISNQQCCEHNLNFVKVDSEFLITKKSHLSSDDMPIKFGFVLNILSENKHSEKNISTTYHGPLLYVNSRDILQLTSVLLI
ncbi:MAG: hypothetical protein EA412_07480 [Chitinophagaceae bacterium]|nr:MAG: hypothetical protein EA412_07480 [Chitinophagaceae bacterium]